MKNLVELEGVTKRFDGFLAVNAATFRIREGEIFSLLGPSGCGKTTLLRMLAGFIDPDEGRLLLDGRTLVGLPPERRPVNTVFQNYALFPHLTVRENIAFGLRMAKRPAAEREREVGRMLELVDLAGQSNKKPHQISGGQKQRVALARALVNRPRVLLLDEPLAALDLKLRQRLLVELDTIHDEVGITFVYVTHDQGEAMAVSDRIGIMCEGRIEQVGTPAEVYESPATPFVATFVGDTNLLPARVAESLGSEYSRAAIEGLGDFRIYNDRTLQPGERVHLSIRPEKLRLAREKPADGLNAVEGTIEDRIYLGSATRYWVRCGVCRLAIEYQHARYLLDHGAPTWGDRVWVSWHPDDGFLIGAPAPGAENAAAATATAPD